MNELDTYNSLKSLGNYLKTEIEVSSGTIERKVRGSQIGSRVTKESDGHTVKVTISNTAPTETDWPTVVFTGVGLVVKFPGTVRISIQRMRNQGALKVDLTNAPQINPFRREGSQRIDGPDYPVITPDEQRQGHVLFPGQSLTYEMSVTSKACPDIKDMKFWVEGNVSRRHLLHFSKELTS